MSDQRLGFLGLGSNVGDPRANMRAVIPMLSASGEMVVSSISSVYETEPVGEVLDQPDFLNAAVRIVTWVPPERLLEICKAIEIDLGRDPSSPRHSPRPIDIDVLLLGDLEMETDALTIPHPQVRNRRFVLEPLVELEPDLVLPDGTEVADCLAALPEGEQRVTRAGPLEP